ncbi:MAG: hypothetical protein AB1606_00775 [Nitrospirota bacterium]
MSVSRDDPGRIKVVFHYDPQLVQKVKTIEGRKWHKSEKCWSFPDSDGKLEEILEVFKGEDIHIDPILQPSTPVIARHPEPVEGPKQSHFEDLRREPITRKYSRETVKAYLYYNRDLFFRRLFFIFLVILINGCASQSSVRNLGVAVVLQGQALTDAALESYSILYQQKSIDKSQQDFIKIVTSPKPAFTLPDTQPKDFSLQLNPRVKAYQELRKVYEAFHRISDLSFADQTKNATESLHKSIRSLKDIPDLPSPVSNIFPKLSALMIETIQAAEIRKHNAILLEFCKAYRELWEQDIPLWKDYLERVYKDYADGLISLNPTSFDEKQLSEIVKEPFSKEIKVGLYKLQKRGISEAKRQEIEAKLDSITRAFGFLAAAHSELAKEEPSLTDLMYIVDSIQSILKEVK